MGSPRPLAWSHFPHGVGSGSDGAGLGLAVCGEMVGAAPRVAVCLCLILGLMLPPPQGAGRVRTYHGTGENGVKITVILNTTPTRNTEKRLEALKNKGLRHFINYSLNNGFTNSYISLHHLHPAGQPSALALPLSLGLQLLR